MPSAWWRGTLRLNCWLLLLLVLRRPRVVLLRHHTAERAAENDVLARIRGHASPHLFLELLLGHEDAITEVDEHVGDRAVARALPITRIRHVLVRRRVVHVADDVEDRALRQQRR